MYRTIVVGTDGSSTARAAVEHASSLALLTGAKLHLVCAMQLPVLATSPEFIAAGFDPVAAAAESAAAALQEATAEATAAGIVTEAHAPTGPPASSLIEIARAVEADLLVVGSRGMHGTRRLIGSIPNTVTHQAPCHVLVVHTA